MNKLFKAILICLSGLIIGCSAFQNVNSPTPKIDPDYSCTEAAFDAYRLLISTDTEFRLVLGWRTDTYKDKKKVKKVMIGAHGWLEYKKPGGEWTTYDTYLIRKVGLKVDYEPIVWGEEAIKYFIVEEYYHKKGYIADIMLRRYIDQKGCIHDEVAVFYRKNNKAKWKKHKFKKEK